MNNVATLWNILSGKVENKLVGHDTGSIITSVAVSQCDLESVKDNCKIGYHDDDSNSESFINKKSN